MNEPHNAPACFGAATVFSHDSTICQACVAFQACADESVRTLEAIKGLINVNDLLKRHAIARKQGLAKMAERDAQSEAQLPPGNVEAALPTKPVERQTKVVDVKFEVSGDDGAVLAKMAIRPREIALRMLKQNDIEGIRAALAEKRNYYAERGPSFLRVTMYALLRGGFTKRSLRELMQQELGWTEGSAASHVGMAVAILAGFKMVQEKGGEFQLVPELTA